MTKEATKTAASDAALYAWVQHAPAMARDIAISALQSDPNDRNLLTVLLQSADAMADAAAAETALAGLARLPHDADTFDLLLYRHLDAGGIAAARTLLAQAEADGGIDPAQSAATRARIALASDDLDAATAILVMAIEAHPNHGALRRLMTETLLAKGSAGHARDVLAHLGQPPTRYDKTGKRLPEGTRDSA